MMRSTLCIFPMIAAGLALTGCVPNRPVHYYTLAPTTPTINVAKPDGPILLVGYIATPEVLQDGRIRYRVGPNEAGMYEYHRWTDRPGIMVRNALVRGLRASGGYQRVIESSSLATGDYLLRGKLHEFGEMDQASIQTRISLEVELVDKKTNRSVWERLIDREEPVNSKNVPDVVQSLDRNLQQVVNQAVTEIAAFVNQHK